MIVIGSDHAGYPLKVEVMQHLKAIGIEYHDVGCYDLSSVDYPLYGQKVAEEVVSGRYEKGIVICGTGIGISIAANKVPGARCALCADVYSARMTRLHNDANILAMGARVIGAGVAEDIVDAFVSTAFEGGRHAKRVDMFTKIEEQYK